MKCGITAFALLVLVLSVGGCAHRQAPPRSTGGGIHLVGIIVPPRPAGAMLVDNRKDPSAHFILGPGESKAGIRVVEIDTEGKRALIEVDGNSRWFYLGSRD